MFPVINLFGREIQSYAILAVAGALICGCYCCRRCRKKGFDDNEIIIMLLVCAAGAIIGGHLLYAVTIIPKIPLIIQKLGGLESFRKIIDFARIIFSGLVFYGGLLGGAVFYAVYCKIRRISLTEYSDIIVPAIPLFHFFGRIGCFLAGCCYGIESNFGFVMTDCAIHAANGVRRFPVQLAEAVFNLVLFMLLAYLAKKEKQSKRLFLIYLIIYSAGRFMLEFLRADSLRGNVYIFSTSQFISIILFFGSAICLIQKSGKNRKNCKNPIDKTA